MRTIYKYEIPQHPGKPFTLNLPLGSRAVALGIQEQAFVLWAEVDNAATSDTHKFCLYFTGQELVHEHARYVDTVTDNVGLVWHLYQWVNS